MSAATNHIHTHTSNSNSTNNNNTNNSNSNNRGSGCISIDRFGLRPMYISMDGRHQAQSVIFLHTCTGVLYISHKMLPRGQRRNFPMQRKTQASGLWPKASHAAPRLLRALTGATRGRFRGRGAHSPYSSRVSWMSSPRCLAITMEIQSARAPLRLPTALDRSLWKRPRRKRPNTSEHTHVQKHK